MDPLTQGLLGATAAEAIAGKRLPHFAWIIGFLAGMAADLDIVIRSRTNPAIFWQYHRQFTHALIFIPIGGALVGLLFIWLFKKLRQQKKTVLLISIVAYATHGLIDCCTSYGTVWFWPFSYERVEWNIISIVDPIFTMILLVGLVAAVQKCRPKIAVLTLCCVLAYLGLGVLQHYRAEQLQEKIARQDHEKIIRGSVDPVVGQLIFWRSIMQVGNQLQINKFALWPMKEEVSAQLVKPLFLEKQLPVKIKYNPISLHTYKVFEWFANGFISQASNKPFTLADMRFVTSFTPATSLWGLSFPKNDPYGKWARKIRLQYSRKRRG